jgi:2-oxo-hept-3-ene-1,7-dioate hydratase
MIAAADIETAAAALDEAERNRKQIGLLSLQHPAIDMEDAYAIQAAWVRRKLAAGRTIKGWKIGLTSRAMQSALNIDIPDSGVLLDDMFFADGATIPSDRFIQPRVEAEIAFVMKTPLEGSALTIADVLDATDFLAPSLEILDTRILRVDPATKKARNVFDTIADNAANAGIVIGGPAMRPRDVDPRWIGAIVSRNGIVEETGLGAGVLDHPAHGVAWLARRLAQYGGGISAGEIILSGSFIRPIETFHGATIAADFGAFGSVSCRFA